MKITAQFLAVIAITSLSNAGVYAIPSYNLTDLGNLGGQSTASSLNDSEQVVGEGLLPNGQATAFLWTANTGMVNLGAMPGEESYASSINNAGEIVGGSWGSADFGDRGILWTPQSGLIDIGSETQMTVVEPFGITEDGQVFGGSDVGGFIYTAAAGFTRVIIPGITVDIVCALNNQGQMVIDTQNTGKVFYSSSEGVVPIRDNAEPAINNFEFGQMNENGMVVGTIPLVTAPTVAMHGFIWDQATGMIDLTPGADDSSTATGINDLGQVVGDANLDGKGWFPFLYENGTLYNLTPYLDATASGWSNIALADINNNGDIAGYGTFSGQTEAFLLTPDGTTSIPEPAGLLLVPGFCLLASSRRRPARGAPPAGTLRC